MHALPEERAPWCQTRPTAGLQCASPEYFHPEAALSDATWNVPGTLYLKQMADCVIDPVVRTSTAATRKASPDAGELISVITDGLSSRNASSKAKTHFSSWLLVFESSGCLCLLHWDQKVKARTHRTDSTSNTIIPIIHSCRSAGMDKTYTSIHSEWCTCKQAKELFTTKGCVCVRGGGHQYGETRGRSVIFPGGVSNAILKHFEERPRSASALTSRNCDTGLGPRDCTTRHWRTRPYILFALGRSTIHRRIHTNASLLWRNCWIHTLWHYRSTQMSSVCFYSAFRTKKKNNHWPKHKHWLHWILFKGPPGGLWPPTEELSEAWKWERNPRHSAAAHHRTDLKVNIWAWRFCSGLPWH